MINFLKSLFGKKQPQTCACCGYEYEEGKLPMKRTSSGFRVCPNAAMKSSLEQLGSGIKLSPELAKELKEKLLYLKQKTEK